MFFGARKNSSLENETERALTAADYEKRLNRKKKLPLITLRQHEKSTPSHEGDDVQFDILNSKGEYVGGLVVNMPNVSNPDTVPSVGFIEAFKKGQGYGRAAYKELIKFLSEKKLKLKSGYLNPSSEPVWEWLVKEGVARITRPGIRKADQELTRNTDDDIQYETI